MSRCFPFPPPGYEKKDSGGQEDLLAKEKQREKKHKKEKKDKEKREGKEKREKDRSKDKQKEKKERKEKKNRDKDKARSSAGEFDKQNESHHEGNLGDYRRKTDGINPSKFTAELAKRIKDDERVAASRMVENFVVAAQRSTNGLCATTAPLTERVASSHEILFSVGNSQRVAETSRAPLSLPSTSQKVGSIASANLLQKGTDEQLGELLNCTPQRGNAASTLPVGKSEVLVRGGSVGSNPATSVEVGKHKINKVASTHGSATQKTINGMAKPAKSLFNLVQKPGDTNGFSTKMEDKRVSDTITNHILTEHKGVDTMGRSADNGPNNTTEGKEKKRDRESHSRKKRHDDKDRDKKKDKEKNKEKEKEKVKTSEEGERNLKKNNELKDGKKSAQKDNLHMKPSILQSVNSTSSHTDGKMKKRKEIGINGFLHENDILTNKIQRTIPSLDVENRKKLELLHVKPASSGVKPQLVDSIAKGHCQVDTEHMTDITAEARSRHPVAIVSNTSVEVPLKPTRLDAKHLNQEVYIKPPHPDAKYLSQIYSVPKMDEWPECNSQEWLFSSPKVLTNQQHNLEADATPQVWAEALRIEPQDVLALPYVIPL